MSPLPQIEIQSKKSPSDKGAMFMPGGSCEPMPNGDSRSIHELIDAGSMSAAETEMNLVPQYNKQNPHYPVKDDRMFKERRGREARYLQGLGGDVIGQSSNQRQSSGLRSPPELDMEA